MQSLLYTAGQLSRAFACISNDAEWGPFSNCRFDFTLFFEQLVLSALPAVIFIILAPIRIYSLYKQNEKTEKHSLRIWKLVFTIAYALLELSLLLQWILLESKETPSFSIICVALDFLAAAGLMILSPLEHSRSVRPSSLLNTYLLFSLILDLPQARTLIVLEVKSFIPTLFAASLGIKLVLLVLEAWGKGAFLKPEYQSLSPESISGILNRSFLWWVNGLFAQGSRSLLAFRNSYNLDNLLTAEYLGNKMQKSWNERTQPESRFALVWATWRCLRASFVLVILPRLCLIAFTFAQPFLISRVISLVSEKDDQNSMNNGYGLIAATGLIYLGIAVSHLQSSHNLYRFITMFRGAAISLIYSKTLTLDDGVYDEAAAVTLMSTDVDSITYCLELLNECWSRSIELVLGSVLLTRELGWVSIIPLVVIALSTIGSHRVALLLGTRKRRWAEATQRRVAITSSMLSDMKSVKMMGLTGMMGDMVQNERVVETKQMERWSWIKVWQNVVSNVPFVMSPALTFSVYAIQAYFRGSDSLNTVQAFTSLALIHLVSDPASELLSAVPNVASSFGSFDRIQEFLLAKPRVDKRISLESKKPHLLDAKNGEELTQTPLIKAPTSISRSIIRIENATIRPSVTADILLEEVNLDVVEGSIVMITGLVGTGKSMLLRAILGELNLDRGSISVGTKEIGYCSQVAWLPSSTIRDAICPFMEVDDFDSVWYSKVLQACSLDYDISVLPNGDQTLIGSRGNSLSGGQKARIALARALYSRPKLFLLDDVFSALDKTTENTMVDCLLGDEGLFRKLGSTVLLVTHASQFLSRSDKILLLPKTGNKLQQGTYDELQSEIIGLRWVKLSNNRRTPDAQFQVVAAGEPPEIMDEKLTEIAESDGARDLIRKTGDIEVYKYYFRSIGAVPLLIFFGFVLLNVLSYSFSQIWLKWWTDAGGSHMLLYISIYFLLALSYSLGVGGYVWAINVWIGPSTGRSLHRVLLDTVLRAPQSFFTNTETGTILNKFSNDMSLIEGQLAIGVLITVSNLVSAIADLALVATGSTYMALTVPFCMIAIYFLQKIYLQTSRQLRYLDLETRSPIYSHFLETLDGLATIRAFGWEENSTKVANQLLDDSQKPYYLLFCIQRWLALVLDLIVAGMAVVVVALATTLRNSTSPGLLGVSLNNVLSFNISLSQFVTGWTMLETSLGAIARLRDFEKDTEIEAQEGEDTGPPSDWPFKGLIEIKSISASYNTSSQALQNVSLTILPGQKVGVCGRTGSGKSTLLSCILNILTPTTGTITIDSLPLSTIPRTLLRQRLIVLPQDPLYIPGSILQNLTPFSLSCPHSTDEIISALQKVQLWTLIQARGGLSIPLLPSSLSKGQFQLLALARALLQKTTFTSKSQNPIVLMDEATSSIDSETEGILQRVIKEEFGGCTVVIVAHRLEMIRECDLVVVMEGGRVGEVGEPGVLMRREGGLFRGLWGKEDKEIGL